jgi:ferredoxin
MIRQIISIDDALCNGCGLCAKACHEGALAIVNGKARLISESYCDGLGNCLPVCPTGAISFVQRETEPFDEAAVIARMPVPALQLGVAPPAAACGCPGSSERTLLRSEAPISDAPNPVASELRQWPVQIRLVNVSAPYLANADLLIAADCTAYAYAAFHRDFIRGRVTLVGCPKLDDNRYYLQKLTEIFSHNAIRSVTVARMEVPCCGGIVTAVKGALLASGSNAPYREVTIAVDGSLRA